ncbi:MAG: FAD binding domain-containing protein [Acidimicrobiia bacterium]
MKLPRFEIHRPTSVTDAVELRADLGDDSVLYAGGTELLLIMKLELAFYSHLIDLKRVADLGDLTVSDQEVSIGSTVTHLQVESSPGIRRSFPALVAMIGRIGNSRVRNSGTLGGNLAFADPHSDPATFLTAVGGTVHLADAEGSTRTVPVAEFTLAPYTTVLRQSELISSLTVPVPNRETTVVHHHLRFRERPAVTATAVIRREMGEVAEARVAVGSVCSVPTRLPAVESLTVDQSGGLEEAIRHATAATIDTVEDLDGSPDYKRHLAGVTVARCVSAALGRPPGEGEIEWS